MVGIW